MGMKGCLREECGVQLVMYIKRTKKESQKETDIMD